MLDKTILCSILYYVVLTVSLLFAWFSALCGFQLPPASISGDVMRSWWVNRNYSGQDYHIRLTLPAGTVYKLVNIEQRLGENAGEDNAPNTL